jgi:hypothetical protein
MRYTPIQIQETFELIIKRIEEGEALRKILKDETMPSSRTFYGWIEDDSIKVKQYAHACNERAEHYFDELIDIADEKPERTSTEFGDKIDNGDVQNRRLKIDARKWALSKMNPKKYSDKMQIDSSEFIEQPLFPAVKKK